MRKRTKQAVSERLLQILSQSGRRIVPDGSGWVLLGDQAPIKHETRIQAIIAGCRSVAVNYPQWSNRQAQLFG